ncbi:MAG: HdeD family acid-resistance protein [Eubacteriales bacterium]
MKLTKQAKWSFWILSAASILLGLCFVIKPQTSAQILCIAFGILTAVLGIVQILCFFRRSYFGIPFMGELSFGVLDLLLGFVMIFHSTGVVKALPVIIGVLLIVNSVFRLQTALEARRAGIGAWWAILVGALLGAVLGVLLVLNPFEGASVLMILCGAALIVEGLENLIAYACVSKHMKDHYTVETYFIDNE